MISLAKTNRAKLFETIADEVWRHVIFNHEVGIDVSEIGLTKDIISVIRHHSNKTQNFGVWSNPGYNEDTYGSDIDIFVEVSVGSFVWFAMQAKVLKQNGRYDDMAGLRKGEFQWDKLNRLSGLTGCITKYLLYNGVKNYSYTGTDNCMASFTEPQFGCSLVNPNHIEKVAMVNKPSFYDFHHKYAQPWRTIVSCKINTSETTLFNTTQIKKAIDHYLVSFGNTSVLETQGSNERKNDFPMNVINIFSEQVGRNPFFRMVIRNTTSIFSE